MTRADGGHETRTEVRTDSRPRNNKRAKGPRAGDPFEIACENKGPGAEAHTLIGKPLGFFNVSHTIDPSVRVSYSLAPRFLIACTLMRT